MIIANNDVNTIPKKFEGCISAGTTELIERADIPVFSCTNHGVVALPQRKFAIQADAKHELEIGSVADDAESASARINELEKELMHYRTMLDKMVQSKTARLERRISILESCNLNLGESYQRMRQMYLELLAHIQPSDTETNMRIVA